MITEKRQWYKLVSLLLDAEQIIIKVIRTRQVLNRLYNMSPDHGNDYFGGGIEMND